MRRVLVFSLLLVLVLAACGAPASSRPEANQQQLPVVTVYKSPT